MQLPVDTFDIFFSFKNYAADTATIYLRTKVPPQVHNNSTNCNNAHHAILPYLNMTPSPIYSIHIPISVLSLLARTTTISIQIIVLHYNLAPRPTVIPTTTATATSGCYNARGYLVLETTFQVLHGGHLRF